ncbi:MAG: sigma-70 family RNA polymerase sigma factor [Acidobacteria bacterium]|nr:sigma-70 family RNA polymerase sigma factor [Acidobacteriota bacterium]
MPHVRSLHNVAMKLTRRREEAEDLVQETLLRGYRFFDRYESGTNIRAWLLTILRNLFVNRYRRARRGWQEVETGGAEGRLETLIERGAASARPETSPEQILVSGCLDGEIERALADLPGEYRMVLTLSAMEGLSYREIAAVLECPIGTVMSRLHRSRRMMQERLMSYAQDRGLLDGPRDEGPGVVSLSDARDSRRRR